MKDFNMTEFATLLNKLKEKQYTWLVTGAAGFIGSNLSEFLLNHNQKVVGLDNLSTGFHHNIVDIKKNVGKKVAQLFKFMEGDIADLIICQKACKGIDIILHQAALGSVSRSIENPITSNRSNITGFLNMLTTAKDFKIKRFIYASSSSVYGDSKELPKREEKTGKLLSPYAVMKMANELYANVFSKTYGMEIIGLRYFNVFGQRQDPNGAYAAVIPIWIDSLLKNKPIWINGDGLTSRDFTYIDNVIQMNLLAGTTSNKQALGKVFNVAFGGKITLNNLYKLLCKELAKNINNFKPIQPIYRDFRLGDIRDSNADISKAQELVGYEPTDDINQGIEKTIKWYMQSHLI